MKVSKSFFTKLQVPIADFHSQNGGYLWKWIWRNYE